MNDTKYKKFINAVAALTPDISFSSKKSLSKLKAHGLDSYIKSLDRDTAELVEIAELLKRMESRGVQHESR